ncbi:hypothetical protein [Ornithinibacillus sp. JPR2-1]|uniref:hypothetical protein n=1 Tax=Ornithinibacillus sp. JPR2-1 TaxID=2094019 RepID=UPI0031D0CCFC
MGMMNSTKMRRSAAEIEAMNSREQRKYQRWKEFFDKVKTVEMLVDYLKRTAKK